MFKYFVVLFSLLIIVSCQKNELIPSNVGLVDSLVFNEIIESNKGNVLVVNVWATWCVPCVEEMPDLIKLADYYKEKKVRLVSISIDYPEEIQSKILPFIKKHKLNFPVYVNNFDKDEALINYINTEWSGAIPATFVYDKNGIQKEFLLGKHSFDDFKKSVAQVL